MTLKEALDCLSILYVTYPHSYQNQSKDDRVVLAKLWQRQFADYDYKIVEKALDYIISTNSSEFAPNISKIKETIIKLTVPEANSLTEQEAWNYVLKALRNSLYNAKQEFDKLPEDIRGIVGSHNQLREWAMMDSERVNSVVSSNFMRSYRARSSQQREMLALPGNVREFLKLTVQEKLQLE